LIKTAAFAVAPSIFSRIRHARSARGQEAALVEVPEWKASRGGEFTVREYSSYGSYLAHQAEKYSLILSKSGGLPRRALVSYRVKFFLRFRPWAGRLRRDAIIVCAGARDGTEVEVWRDLGFYRAIGIDLNPGPGNSLVIAGDFNRLPFADGSVDLLYCNAVDHAFDLDTMFAEARRVLRHDGLVLFDVNTDGRGRHEATYWDRPERALLKMMEHFERVERVEHWRQWLYVTLRPTA
jgi:SAM-dependent methyltransferase